MTEPPKNLRIIILDFWTDEARVHGFAALAAMLKGTSAEQLQNTFEKSGNIQIKDLPVAVAEKLSSQLEMIGILSQMVEEPYDPANPTIHPSATGPTPQMPVPPVPPPPANDLLVPGIDEEAVATAPSPEAADEPTPESSRTRNFLKPMGLIEIIYRSSRLYSDNFRFFFGIAFGLTLLGYAVIFGAIAVSMAGMIHGGPPSGLGDFVLSAIAAVSFIIIAAIVYWLIFFYMIGCLVAGADMRIRGEDGAFSQVRQRLKGKTLSLIWATMLSALIVISLSIIGIVAAISLSSLLKEALEPFDTAFAIMLALIVLLYPSVILLSYLLVPNTVVLEGRRGLDALRRSSALMRYKAGTGFLSWNINRGGLILTIVFLTNLAITILSLIAHLAAGGVHAMTGDVLGLFSSLPLYIDIPLQVLTVALQAAITPFWACAMTWLYYDARVRQEGLEVEVP